VRAELRKPANVFWRETDLILQLFLQLLRHQVRTVIRIFTQEIAHIVVFLFVIEVLLLLYLLDFEFEFLDHRKKLLVLQLVVLLFNFDYLGLSVEVLSNLFKS
jgi:hypothetical protein